MIISREYIPLGILKEINDPAYHIFRNAYVLSIGEERTDHILNHLIERKQALCNREMGWCIPDAVTTLHDILELDHDRPLYTETLPYFEIPDHTRRFPFIEEKRTIFFFYENEEYGCFSQWFYSPFTVEGIRYSTAEQYMMAKKALLFNDYDIYNQILNEKDPYKSKKKGKLVHNFKGHRWNECKEEIVYRANLAKFHRIMTSNQYF